MFRSSIKQLTIVAICVFTLIGLSLHDTRTDVATGLIVGIPALLAAYEGDHLVSTSHTHVEQMDGRSLNQAFMTTYTPPRYGELKKHLMQRRASRGHHAFDNYNLPIV